MSSDHVSKSFTNQLRISIEGLYKNSEDILREIEAGMMTMPHQAPIVGYQGVPGAYGEQAAYSYFEEKWSSLIAHESFEDVIEALEEGRIDYGILPIENSSAGEILDTYDFMKSQKLYIIGEQTIKIEHNLLGVIGSTIEDIQEVYSHPQAISQSKEFLKKHKTMMPHPYINTAAACQYVAREQDLTKAAIGSKRAARLYNLSILAPDIHYNKNNFTRFVVLSKRMHITPLSNKISIIFGTAHTSGSLYNMLGHFAYNGLNLLKIQSRPMLDKKWEYFFFADLEGNLQDANVLVALSKMIEQCSFFKILGNYEKSQ